MMSRKEFENLLYEKYRSLEELRKEIIRKYIKKYGLNTVVSESRLLDDDEIRELVSKYCEIDSCGILTVPCFTVTIGIWDYTLHSKRLEDTFYVYVDRMLSLRFTVGFLIFVFVFMLSLLLVFAIAWFG